MSLLQCLRPRQLSRDSPVDAVKLQVRRYKVAPVSFVTLSCALLVYEWCCLLRLAPSNIIDIADVSEEPGNQDTLRHGPKYRNFHVFFASQLPYRSGVHQAPSSDGTAITIYLHLVLRLRTRGTLRPLTILLKMCA